VQDRTLSDRRREHRPARWVRDHRTRQCLRHPPLSLRDISPSRGEIGSSWPAPRQSPPLWGRCPAGQRGVSCRHVASVARCNGAASLPFALGLKSSARPPSNGAA
jgi:hypothetical protein